MITLFTAQTDHLEAETEAGDVIATDLLAEALRLEFPAYDVHFVQCDEPLGQAIIWIKSVVEGAPRPEHLAGWGTTGEYGITLELVR